MLASPNIPISQYQTLMCCITYVSLTWVREISLTSNHNHGCVNKMFDAFSQFAYVRDKLRGKGTEKHCKKTSKKM